MNELKELRPFRFWCQKVLPSVYDDSLSYSELLDKVVAYLNEIGEQQNLVKGNFETLQANFDGLEEQFEALTGSFVNLGDYVQDYLENHLDDELEAKLDEWATDGTLTNLLAPLVSTQVQETAPDVISDWLDENVTPIDPNITPIVDSSLSVEGAAADAKATGDAITNLSERTRLTYKNYTQGVSANTLLENGIYFASLGSYILDLPYGTGVGGWLEVTRSTSSSNTVLQVFYPSSVRLANTPKWRFYRATVNEWSDWKEYVSFGLDDSLTEQGAAADAKATGDAITNLRGQIQDVESLEKQLDYNSFEAMNFVEHTNHTYNGVTYVWGDDNTCSVVGETPAGTPSFTNLFASTTSLPNWMKQGKTYDVKFSQTASNASLYYQFFDGDGNGMGTNYIQSNSSITVPNNAHGVQLRINVLGGRTVETLVTISIINALTNLELQEKISEINEGVELSRPSRTAYGITFSWSNNICHVTGTPTQSVYDVLFNNATALPDGLIAGRVYRINYTGNQVSLHITYYYDDETEYSEFIQTSVLRKIPENLVGIRIRLAVLSSASNVDEYVNPVIFTNLTMQVNDYQLPTIITFIDDDTTNDTYVSKYYNSCKHNSIIGNFALIVGQLVSGVTSVNDMLSYEDEGFGVLMHCYHQGDYWQRGATHDEAACRADLTLAIRQAKQYGFINADKYWVSPGGHTNADVISMARGNSFDCLISMLGANVTYNSYTWDKLYNIRRVGLTPYDDHAGETLADIKSHIDAVANNGGWLIITTHFNEWGSLTWDDTDDENGYPIGYSRFNEMAQYAKSKTNVQIMSFPEAFSYYKYLYAKNNLQ